MLGCIDGTFIPMRTPYHKIKSTYVNRHDMPAITMQGICGPTKLFLDVFTGLPGKIHDARVYNLSFISKRLPQECGQRFHILGDSAYPIRRWLLTPYRDYGNLTEKQKKYNRRHCGTRVRVENAFGLLKQRWLQLTRTDFATVPRTADFIMSCCVLHNLCILNDDEWKDDNVDNQQEQEIAHDEAGQQQLKAEGEEKRDFICNSF